MKFRVDKRPVLFPVGVSLALFVVVLALWTYDGGFYNFILAVLFYFIATPLGACLALLAAAALVFLFWRRSRISGIAMASGLAVLSAAVAVPAPGESIANWTSELINVISYRDKLLQQAQEERRKGFSPALAAIDIGGFAGRTWGIAFDPTGEVMLPRETRSAAWKASAKDAFWLDDIRQSHVRHIVGSYYTWTYP